MKQIDEPLFIEDLVQIAKNFQMRHTSGERMAYKLMNKYPLDYTDVIGGYWIQADEILRRLKELRKDAKI